MWHKLNCRKRTDTERFLVVWVTNGPFFVFIYLSFVMCTTNMSLASTQKARFVRLHLVSAIKWNWILLVFASCLYFIVYWSINSSVSCLIRVPEYSWTWTRFLFSVLLVRSVQSHPLYFRFTSLSSILCVVSPICTSKTKRLHQCRLEWIEWEKEWDR